MSSFEEVNTARERLMEALGEKSKQYIQHMKSWFQMKISKEDFDCEARKLLDSNQTSLHNQFLLQLFIKCSKQGTLDASPSSSAPLHRTKSKRRGRQHNGGFQAVNIHEYIQSRLPPTPQEEPPRYCVQELLLPDCELIHMRLMLASWELGLKGAEQSAAEILVIAVQHFLKNILTAIFSRRSGYRIREGKIQYAIGMPAPNPWLRNTAEYLSNNGDRSVLEVLETGETVPVGRLATSENQLDIALSYAAAGGPTCPVKQRVTPAHCFEALQIHRSAVASQSVYSTNMERIISQLHHPSWEEMGE